MLRTEIPSPPRTGVGARHDLVISFVIQQTDDTPSMAHDRVLRRDSKSKWSVSLVPTIQGPLLKRALRTARTGGNHVRARM